MRPNEDADSDSAKFNALLKEAADELKDGTICPERVPNLELMAEGKFQAVLTSMAEKKEKEKDEKRRKDFEERMQKENDEMNKKKDELKEVLKGVREGNVESDREEGAW